MKLRFTVSPSKQILQDLRREPARRGGEQQADTESAPGWVPRWMRQALLMFQECVMGTTTLVVSCGGERP